MKMKKRRVNTTQNGFVGAGGGWGGCVLFCFRRGGGGGGGGGWSKTRPGSFGSGKHTRYPLYRRMGGPQDDP